MRIAVTGGTGFIGSRLIDYLQRSGHETIVISRSAVPGRPAFTWSQLLADPSPLEGVDAIVNLAGESINQRWTAKAKTRIIQSRLQAAGRIAAIVSRLSAKPQVVVNASGMSIYGVSETETFDEASPARSDDFLSSVVQQWEQAADQIEDTRLVKIRVGLVLSGQGGAFPLMALPFKLGAGGKVGSGRQWLSWIHIEDMVRLIDFCIRNEAISGPVNATAPQPVTNEQFGRELARALRRPNWLPVPAFMLKLLLGEMSDLLLNGQKVLPDVLLSHGFAFSYPSIDSALQEITGGRAGS